MIEHLRSLRDVTSSLWPSFVYQAPLESPTQILVWQGASGAGPAELAVCADGASFEADVRLLARAELGEAVSIMLGRCRAVLAPGVRPAMFEVAGRYATVRWVRSEFVMPDRDVTVPGTNRNPFYGIDTYSISSQPVGV